MKCRVIRLAGILVATAACAVMAALSFTSQPVLAPAGAAYTVSFAVSEAADVEVSIVNRADSSVVRHLAAGLLGPNPPAPLAANSLSQTLAWDGRDDLGNTVTVGSDITVRVRAGVSHKLADVVGENYYAFGQNVMGLAADASGRVFVCGTSGNLPHMALREYDQTGNYVKTLFPSPANADPAKIRGFGIVEWPDQSFTLKSTVVYYPSFATSNAGNVSAFLASDVPRDSLLLFVPGTLNSFWMRTDGSQASAANAPLVTSPAMVMSSSRSMNGPTYVTLSRDAKTAYVSGVYAWNRTLSMPLDTGFWRDGAVYKVDLASKSATALFRLDSVPYDSVTRRVKVGPQYLQTGRSSFGLMAAVHGTALDDSGRLFICDRLHQQVGVYDAASGAFLGAVPVENPDLVAVNRTTGVIYVASRSITALKVGSISIRKFSGWRPGHIQLDSLRNMTTVVSYIYGLPNGERSHMTLSQAGGKSVLWFVNYPGMKTVLAIEDGALGLKIIRDFKALAAQVNLGFDRIAVDKKTETVYIQDSWSTISKIENWALPRLLPCSTSNRKPLNGQDMTVSFDRYLYVRTGTSFSGPIQRYTLDRLHAPANFPSSDTNYVTKYVYNRYGINAGNAERGLSVDRNGRVACMDMGGWNIYQVESFAGNGDTTRGVLAKQITGPSGGVKWDLKGNLYIGQYLRYPDHVMPSVYTGDWGYNIAVGSVVRLPADSLAADTPNVDLTGAVTVKKFHGADKVYTQGLAPFSHDGGSGCVCRSPRFDVDEYGRLYIPNAITCRVNMTDNNGNTIMEVGKYGNVDSRGPGSLVPTGHVPFCYPVGAAASEDYLYVTDMVNNRLLRIKLDYALDNIPGLTDKNPSTLTESRSTAALFGLSVAPNPAASGTLIKVKLPQNSWARVEVFNANGRMVQRIHSAPLKKGTAELHWDGSAMDGAALSAGQYFIRLSAMNRTITRRVTLTR